MDYGRAIKKYTLYAIILFLPFIILGCGKGLIKKGDMPYLIAEIYKADKYIGVTPRIQRHADSVRIYEAVLLKEGYTLEQFNRTIEHYLLRPTKLKEFYTKAQLLVEEELKTVTLAIDKERNLQALISYIGRFIEDSTTLYFEVPLERAWSWIGSPNNYPKWQFSFSDSLNALYETPKLENWWLKNLENREYSYNYIDCNEENSSPVALPLQRDSTYKKRDGGFREERESIRDKRVSTRGR